MKKKERPRFILGAASFSSLSMEDMLGVLITSGIAKESGASESVFPKGYGTFLAGETRDKTLTGVESASELAIIALSS